MGERSIQEGCLFETMSWGVGHSFTGGYLLECGCLFEEIQYVTVFLLLIALSCVSL